MSPQVPQDSMVGKASDSLGRSDEQSQAQSQPQQTPSNMIAWAMSSAAGLDATRPSGHSLLQTDTHKSPDITPDHPMHKHLAPAIERICTYSLGNGKDTATLRSVLAGLPASARSRVDGLEDTAWTADRDTCLAFVVPATHQGQLSVSIHSAPLSEDLGSSAWKSSDIIIKGSNLSALRQRFDCNAMHDNTGLHGPMRDMFIIASTAFPTLFDAPNIDFYRPREGQQPTCESPTKRVMVDGVSKEMRIEVVLHPARSSAAGEAPIPLPSAAGGVAGRTDENAASRDVGTGEMEEGEAEYVTRGGSVIRVKLGTPLN